jgi:hypothetical protein
MAVSKRCGITIATRSPRFTPSDRSKPLARFAASCSCAYDSERPVPWARIATRFAAPGCCAQRPQHTCAMLNRCGTCQRKPSCMAR